MYWCFNLNNDQCYSPDKNRFIEILNLCSKKRSVQDGDLFFFENRPKLVLKDVAIYALTFHCNYGVYDDFQNRGLIFRNCKLSNWHKNLSAPKIQPLFY